MLYSLFKYLAETDFPGARLMDYITFRSGAALLLSLFIALVFGRKIIDRLQKMQVGEIIRNLGLEGADEENRHAHNGWHHNHSVNPCPLSVSG